MNFTFIRNESSTLFIDVLFKHQSAGLSQHFICEALGSFILLWPCCHGYVGVHKGPHCWEVSRSACSYSIQYHQMTFCWIKNNHWVQTWSREFVSTCCITVEVLASHADPTGSLLLSKHRREEKTCSWNPSWNWADTPTMTQRNQHCWVILVLTLCLSADTILQLHILCDKSRKNCWLSWLYVL